LLLSSLKEEGGPGRPKKGEREAAMNVEFVSGPTGKREGGEVYHGVEHGGKKKGKPSLSSTNRLTARGKERCAKNQLGEVAKGRKKKGRRTWYPDKRNSAWGRKNPFAPSPRLRGKGGGKVEQLLAHGDTPGVNSVGMKKVR